KPKARAIKSQRDFSSTFVHLNDFLLFSNACKCSVYKASRYMLSCNLTYRPSFYVLDEKLKRSRGSVLIFPQERFNFVLLLK
uniref:hypothetical protein n=1 Tax=Alloprevotella sp. TaxID=1872471 RepID=UPI0040292E17